MAGGRYWGFAGLLALAYVLPPVLILAGVIPFEFRFPMLLITTGIVAAYVVWKGDGAAALGFRKDTLKRALVYSLGITSVALLAIGVMHELGVIRTPTIPAWRWFFVFYVFVSCPAQEFLYRSALFAEMECSGITGKVWQIAISTVAYCFLHVIYRDAITLGVTLLMGIVWGVSYRFAKNFWGVTLSHCVLGTVSILVGLI
jgi:hypothetical protein